MTVRNSSSNSCISDVNTFGFNGMLKVFAFDDVAYDGFEF